jgi:hypothetical protein
MTLRFPGFVLMKFRRANGYNPLSDIVSDIVSDTNALLADKCPTL